MNTYVVTSTFDSLNINGKINNTVKIKTLLQAISIDEAEKLCLIKGMKNIEVSLINENKNLLDTLK